MGPLIIDRTCYACILKCPWYTSVRRFHRQGHKATKGQLRYNDQRLAAERRR